MIFILHEMSYHVDSSLGNPAAAAQRDSSQVKSCRIKSQLCGAFLQDAEVESAWLCNLN
jgi:hypothetical protein